MKSLKVAPILLTLAAGIALCAPSYIHAQATEQRGATPQRTGAQAKLFDPKDTVILLLDHQTGLFQTVKDITIQELRTNTAVLAKLATVSLGSNSFGYGLVRCGVAPRCSVACAWV